MLFDRRLVQDSSETYAFCPPHRVRHLLITPEGLYPESDSLQLRSHLVELLDVAPCPDEILCHDLARILAAS